LKNYFLFRKRKFPPLPMAFYPNPATALGFPIAFDPDLLICLLPVAFFPPVLAGFNDPVSLGPFIIIPR
jgi:hypothetical protein